MYEEDGNPRPDILTKKQLKMCCLILAGHTAQEISAQTGCNPKTVYKFRLRHKSFLRQAQLECFNAAMAELTSQSSEIAQYIKCVALDENQPTKYRLQAASIALDWIRKSKDDFIEERIRKLEELAGISYESELKQAFNSNQVDIEQFSAEYDEDD